MRRALEEPIKQIALNAGLEGGVVVEKVRALKEAEGLNAATGEYGDMIEVRRRRPGEGHALGAAERGVDRRAVPDDRGDRGGEAREGARDARGGGMPGGDMDF